MLYLSTLGLLLLILGLIILKKSVKLVALGIVCALVGAAAVVLTVSWSVIDDQSRTAKCASLDGHYGGGSCYVQGVEKDLNNLENFVKKEVNNVNINGTK